MALPPKLPVSLFLRDAIRHPDGIAAYGIAALSVALAVAILIAVG
jgi:hypothetical protein